MALDLGYFLDMATFEQVSQGAYMLCRSDPNPTDPKFGQR